jgi:hypothetical protein
LSTDWYTKLVLTVIAASAAFFVAEHLNREDAGGEGSYKLQAIPMGRILLRLNTETGETWRTALNKPSAWKKIAESPIEAEGEAAEAAPAAADPAPPPAPDAKPKLDLNLGKPEAPPSDE